VEDRVRIKYEDKIMSINMKLKAREDQIHSFDLDRAAYEIKLKTANSQKKEVKSTEVAQAP